VGQIALWLLARPFAVSFRIAIYTSIGAIALGIGLAFLTTPWWALAFFLVVAVLGVLVCVGWVRLARGGELPIVYLARFSYEAPGDASASANHHYLLLERFRANSLLSGALEVRSLDNITLKQARRISQYTKRAVVTGHVITAGGSSRWDATCSVSWPDAYDSLYLFHSPLRIVTHSVRTGNVGKRYIFTDTERLALDPAVPLEYLVSATLAAKHVDAIEGTLCILAAVEAEVRGQTDLASRLLVASKQFNKALPSRARALREITLAVLHVKTNGIGARRAALEKAQRAATAINHADLWGFLNTAWYAGEAEGWALPSDREQSARAAYAATPVEEIDLRAHYKANLASTLVATGRPDEAKILLYQALAESKDAEFEAHSDLGVIFYNDRDFEAAETHYSAAVSISRNPPALVVLGDVYAQTRRFSEALALYREALLHDPLYPRAHIAYSRALVMAVIGEGTLIIRASQFIRHVAYPLLLTPGSRVSKCRFLRFPTLVYLRHTYRRHPENQATLFLIGMLALYEQEFGVAQLIFTVIRNLSSSDAARAAALVPIAYGLDGDLPDAIANLDWLIEEERNPTIPAAVNAPAEFRQLVRDTLLIPFDIEPRLTQIAGSVELRQAIEERFF
jgi:tetratricopeptide (TPR) repeat protein